MTHVPWHPDDMENLEDAEELHGIESVELNSVGIDIGTTTTHLMFSRLLARRQGSDYSSKFKVVEREIEHKSDIMLTPYLGDKEIDTEKVSKFIDQEYAKAGFSSDEIDTGAVIITGEACRKENADAIIDLFSDQAGKFVCATAGANLEALMAAYGSGAVDYSLDTDQTVLNIDIGGGTTKFAQVIDGFVEETASINVGTRLVAFDKNERITRLEEAVKTIAEDTGLQLEHGMHISEGDRERLARSFADLLFQVVDADLSPLARELMVTEIPDPIEFDVLTFSGGGSEYIYDRNPGFFTDLGPELGDAVRTSVSERDISMAELDTGIRATVVGSTQHTVQVSGNTILVTDESLLPLRNIPIIPFVAGNSHGGKNGDLERSIIEKIDLYDVDTFEQPFAMGFHLHGRPTLEMLQEIVTSAISGLEHANSEYPLILVFDTDIAMNAGRLAADRLDRPVVAVDNVELDQFGYIDIGEQLAQTSAVPVTVKSLVFEG